MSVYVKENHNLSHERCSVMTVVSSSADKESTPPAEFVFKGKGETIERTYCPSQLNKSSVG